MKHVPPLLPYSQEKRATPSFAAERLQKSEQERLDKAQRLDALLSVIQEVEQKTAAIKDWTALIRKYMNVQVLDRETIDELIDHIEIGERTVTDGKRHQEIKVFYRFVGQIK